MKKKPFPFALIIIFTALVLVFNYLPYLKNKSISVLQYSTGGISGFLFRTGHSISQTFRFVADIGNLKKENANLTDRIYQLQIDQSQISELENENKLLKQELGFLADSDKGSLVPARIIDRDPLNYLDYLVVDKGSSEGILTGQAAVFNGILIGRVEVTYENSSKIRLITSKDSLIQAMLQDSRSKGILKGGNSGLYLDNIVSDTDIKAGEYIVTSGLGGGLKEGILIGRAGEVQSFSSGIFKSITVEPLVDLSKLELIFIQK
ncbi:MAG: rod shape-determining protein MreC [Candidatus Berkelbacteria bacterium]|nr:rod shape-determining protein MreC [Candidatus Berkelbacteria bacterium]